MPTTTIIGHGAEAIVELVHSDSKKSHNPMGENVFPINYVIKKRIIKKYRLPQIDTVLRHSRTKREFKVLEKLSFQGISVPKVISATDDSITMEHILGDSLKNILNAKNAIFYSSKVGEIIATIHNHTIVHGDLTTSNIMITPNKKPYIIDFGLAFFTHKVEDKAVDLHLFIRSLTSKHPLLAKKAQTAFLKGYSKKSNDTKEILNRLKEVEGRGRNKKH